MKVLRLLLEFVGDVCRLAKDFDEVLTTRINEMSSNLRDFTYGPTIALCYECGDVLWPGNPGEHILPCKFCGSYKMPEVF